MPLFFVVHNGDILSLYYHCIFYVVQPMMTVFVRFLDQDFSYGPLEPLGEDYIVTNSTMSLRLGIIT